MMGHRRRIPPKKGGRPKQRGGKKLPNPRKRHREMEDALVRRLLSGDYRLLPHDEKGWPDEALKEITALGATPSEVEHSLSAFIAEFGDLEPETVGILFKALKRWRKAMPPSDRIYRQVAETLKKMSDDEDTRFGTETELTLGFVRPIIECGLTDPKIITFLSYLFTQSELASRLIASDLKLEGREIVIEYHKLPWGPTALHQITDESDCNDFFADYFHNTDFEEKMNILYDKRVRYAICKQWFIHTLSIMIKESGEVDWPWEYTGAIGIVFGLPKERYLPFLPELVGVVRRHQKLGKAPYNAKRWYSDDQQVQTFSFNDEHNALIADTIMDARDWMFRFTLFHWLSHMCEADSCPIIWTDKNAEILRKATDGMERPDVLDDFDKTPWEGWSRYCWETGVLNRWQTAFLKQQQKAMSFIMDPDTRELIINQGLPTRIHPDFMRLPYSSMYLDVRLPLPDGSLVEGIFIQEIDDSPWENHREGCGGAAVAFNMNTCETFEVPAPMDITRGGEPLMLVGGNTLHSQGHASVFEDIKRRWIIKWIETDGIERSVWSNELEVSTWGDDPVFPARPRNSGNTKDYRAIVDFIIGLLLFIQLPDVEWVDVGKKGTAKSIKKREAKRESEGMPPLPERRVIQLSGEVKRYVNRIASGEGSGTRYHQVRGHFRTLRSERYKEENRGRVIWVREHHKGWGSNNTQEYEVKR
jgi:hypothetical protein